MPSLQVENCYAQMHWIHLNGSSWVRWDMKHCLYMIRKVSFCAHGVPEFLNTSSPSSDSSAWLIVPATCRILWGPLAKWLSKRSCKAGKIWSSSDSEAPSSKAGRDRPWRIVCPVAKEPPYMIRSCFALCTTIVWSDARVWDRRWGLPIIIAWSVSRLPQAMWSAEAQYKASTCVSVLESSFSRACGS